MDNKMMGLLYLHANNVQALLAGGMFANFTKATLLRPRAKALLPSDPNYSSSRDFAVWTPETIKKKCDEVLAEIGKLTLAGTDERTQHEKILTFCRERGHGFFEHKLPLSQVEFALFDPLHGFTNEAEYERGLYNDYSEELQGTHKLTCKPSACAPCPGVLVKVCEPSARAPCPGARSSSLAGLEPVTSSRNRTQN